MSDDNLTWRRLPLANGFEALVSACDFDNVVSACEWRWTAIDGKKYVRGYLGGGVRVFLHRWLLNPQKGFVVDHINGDAIDNRRDNLRVVSQSSNQRNRKGAQKNSASGIRGVSFDPSSRKWRAFIFHDNKHINLGRFDCIHDAVAARHAAEDKLWDTTDVYQSRKAWTDAISTIRGVK